MQEGNIDHHSELHEAAYTVLSSTHDLWNALLSNQRTKGHIQTVFKQQVKIQNLW